MSSFTIKQARYVEKLRKQGNTWVETQAAFRDKYGLDKTHDNLRMSTKYHLGEADLTTKLKHSEKPKILIYDIETSPMLGYVWGLWDNNVSLNMLHKDWNILSYAAKWLGEPEVYYGDQSKAKDIENEHQMLKGIWKVLNEADIVITHNGKRFDQKKLNARFFKYGMKPVGTKKHIDTLVIAKREFAFTSNKLEYLTDQFCVKHKKMSHAKFPGFKLWVECLKGNKEAWAEMKAYNIMDVKSLEELYLKMAPYDSTVNFNLFHDRLEAFCNCGSTEFNKNGFSYTNSGKFQKYTCKSCGSSMRGRDNLLSKEKRKSLKNRA